MTGNTNFRQMNVVNYEGTSASGGSRGPTRGCTIPPVTPLTNDRTTIDGAIDVMNADGYTHIPLGIAWGWRVISPGEPFTQGTAYDDPDWNKAVVILTDGENTIDTESNWNYSNYSAYGHLRKGRFGTTDSSTFVDNLNTKTTTLCNKLKDNNVRVYTLTFQVSTDTVRDLMRDCASDPSLYFDSPSGTELRAAFKAIGVDLNNLRISK
ncbi:MAG: hypothetical protein ACR2OR_16470 [Hyphomicrobiales bacterium]